MATPAQINANRINAQRSTGPRSDAGKAASRFNALKHGIEARSLVIPGEDPAELDALALDYQLQFHPVGPLEDFLVDTVVQADWNRRRYSRIEGEVLQVLMTDRQSAGEHPLGAFLDDAALRISRRLAAAERSYFRALKELRRAQRDRKAEEEEACGEPATVPDPVRASPSEPPIGFVPAVRMQPVSQSGARPQTASGPSAHGMPIPAPGNGGRP